MSRTTIDTDTNGVQPPPEDDRAFFGHPRGLLSLSGLEVWERFSFLGMQAILVLHFAAAVSDGGLGMAAGTAASVSAGYGTLVYLVSVAGGRLADRKGYHWGFSAAALGMTLGLIQYVAGRRHLAGRKHSAEFALAPEAMRRAVRLIAFGVILGGLSFLLMVLPTSGHADDTYKTWMPSARASERRRGRGRRPRRDRPGALRRTMHPVHQGATRYPR